MKDNFIQKAISDIRNVHLSRQEKDAMKHRIMSAVPAEDRRYWSLSRTCIEWLRRNERWCSALFVALLLSACAGTVVTAQNSLPGDPLYAMKVDITEPVREMLAWTPEAKARLALELAHERLSEAAALSAQNRLDPMNVSEIDGLVADHARYLDSALENLGDTPVVASNSTKGGVMSSKTGETSGTNSGSGATNSGTKTTLADTSLSSSTSKSSPRVNASTSVAQEMATATFEGIRMVTKRIMPERADADISSTSPKIDLSAHIRGDFEKTVHDINDVLHGKKQSGKNN